MEKTIKPNKDNDLKYMEGLGVTPSQPYSTSEEKKESAESKDPPLEYFCE